MIYEVTLVTSTDLSSDELTKISDIVKETSQSFNGDIMVQDDWGVLKLAQPTSTGVLKGHFLFFIVKGDSKMNTELVRRFRITESIMKHLIIKKCADDKADSILKGLKTPFSSKYPGSVTDVEESENSDGDSSRRFSRRKSCWFSARQIVADYKDPKTYVWLVNEFGKISPARSSSIARRHQRNAVEAIKRARQLGLISHMSNQVAEK